MFTRAAAIGRVQARLASNDAVILGYARTPIGRFQGGLSSVPATKLGETALSAAAEKAGVSMDEVQECYFGNVIAAGLGQAPARQVALGAGAQLSTPCTTVNKVCASGTKTVMLAAMAVQTGVADVVAAGGMESMSNIPYIMPQARKGFGYGHGQVVDALLADGLTDSFDKHHMGMCAEKCNKDHGITREQQDEYAKQSYTRAASAWDRGFFDDEIAPVSVPQRRGDPKVVSVDEEYTNVKFDKIGSLRPAFDKNGSVTAANASTLNDGAAALIVSSQKYADEKGLTPLAIVRAYADAAVQPVDFPVAPAPAIEKVLANAGLTVDDIDLFELNEAFASVSLANMKLLGIDNDKINVNGGAVALGHPIGMSGARIVGTLARALREQGKRYGVAAICNGGGGASAVLVENPLAATE